MHPLPIFKFIMFIISQSTFPCTYMPVDSHERVSYAQREQKMAWRVPVMHENAGLH